ncbi:Pol Polyprotein [Phytophthora cinnamomi]|uniref:Pol Polyprotein n=1 Tax=Phytophthora cinnamomi TaxID=4785 RepID=UPI0035593A56|nr:Pol Polyprotein [Phytophthora cinnamomi]
MDYAADDEEDQVAFVEDIQVLLFDEDQQQFNDSVTEESILRLTTALQRLTEIHCPDGTRGVILDKMSVVKKTRGVSVREYIRSIRKLGRMLNYIMDNEAIPTSDVVRMYKSGMPIHWQIEANRLSRSWEYNDLVHQFELIERNE